MSEEEKRTKDLEEKVENLSKKMGEFFSDKWTLWNKFEDFRSKITVIGVLIGIVILIYLLWTIWQSLSVTYHNIIFSNFFSFALGLLSLPIISYFKNKFKSKNKK